MDDPGAQYLSKDPGLSHETEKVLFDLDLEVLWAAISLALAVQPIVVCASEQCLSASSLNHHSRSLKVLVHGYLVLGEHRHQGLFELFEGYLLVLIEIDLSQRFGDLQVCHRLVQHEHRSFELGACDKAVPVLVEIAEHGLDFELVVYVPHFTRHEFTKLEVVDASARLFDHVLQLGGRALDVKASQDSPECLCVDFSCAFIEFQKDFLEPAPVIVRQVLHPSGAETGGCRVLEAPSCLNYARHGKSKCEALQLGPLLVIFSRPDSKP